MLVVRLQSKVVLFELDTIPIMPVRHESAYPETISERHQDMNGGGSKCRLLLTGDFRTVLQRHWPNDDNNLVCNSNEHPNWNWD